MTKQPHQKATSRPAKRAAGQGSSRNSLGPIVTVVIIVGGILLLMVVGGWLGGASVLPTPTATPTRAPRPTPLTSATPNVGPSAAPAQVSPEIAQRNNRYSEAPPQRIDPTKYYQAVIRTNKGDIGLQLFHREAPQAVNSFVYLTQEGFYDGMPFWAVNPGEVAMTGDPLASGAGGPGYDLPLEISGWRHTKPGMVALGRFPDSERANGSQFYITLAAQPGFDGRYPIFGEVIYGMNTVEQLEVGDVMRSVSVFEVDPQQPAAATPAP